MQKKIDDPDAWDAGMPEARRIVFRMLECDKPINILVATFKNVCDSLSINCSAETDISKYPV